MSFPAYTFRNSAHRPRQVSFGGLVKLMVVLALVGVAGWLLFQRTVHSKLTSAISEKLAVHLRPLGIDSKIGDARFHDGRGLTLDNVELALPATNDPAGADVSVRLTVGRLHVHADAVLTDLVAGSLRPSAVELNRAKLQILKGGGSSFDFSQIVEQLANLPRPAGGKLAPVILRDSEIQIVDRDHRVAAIRLVNVNFVLAPKLHGGKHLLHVQGEFQSSAISKIDVSVFIDPNERTWSAQLGADGATLSPQVLDILPPDWIDPSLRPERLAGSLSFTASARGGSQLDQWPTFELRGGLDSFLVDDPRLPVPVRECSASFFANNDGVVVQNLKGRVDGDCDFEIDYAQSGILQRGGWRCQGQVNRFLVDKRPRLGAWLHGTCGKLCRDFSPMGVGDVHFDISHDGNRLSRSITAKIRDMSFSFIKMPYRVDHCSGEVKLVDDHSDFTIRSTLDGQPVGLHGWADGVGSSQGSTFQANLEVPGTVRIDEKLLTATEALPTLAKILRDFNPTGRVGGGGVIQRRTPQGPVSKNFDLRLRECNIRHRYFDYPIYNVRGDVAVRDLDFTFENLQGNNGSGLVGCNGTWNPVNGLHLDFHCRSVPLNDQLRLALRRETREIWDGFRPRGTLDQVDLQMTMPIGKREVQVGIEAKLPEQTDANANYVSIFPVWFPYRIHHLTGRVNIGHGRIRLTNINGVHDGTTLACHGQGHYSDVSWSLRLTNLLVNSLKVDADLLAAVPQSMATPLAQLRFAGLANVNGEITLAGNNVTNDFVPTSGSLATGTSDGRSPVQLASHQQSIAVAGPSNSSMAWDVRVNMNQASMLVGVPLKNVFGGVRLKGIYDGDNVDCNGQLDLDSMTLYDNQITDVTGPFRIENHRVSAGTFVQQNISSFESIQKSRSLGKAPSIAGILHQGIVRLDAQMDTTDKNEFYLQTTLSDGSLAAASQEFAPDLDHVDGHCFAAFRLTGNGSGTHSHRGNGNVQLRDAQIYELPVFISLLKILNVRQLTRTAFDSGGIDFQIMGERIIFDRMEFIGDAISLIGNGEANLDWDVDLNFYSVVGRNRINIPLISELYRAGSQRTLAIKVDGKLDNPRTHRQVLPELNDNLKRLFNGRQQTLIGQIGPLPQRPSASSQPLRIGESFFNQPGGQPSQIFNGLRR